MERQIGYRPSVARSLEGVAGAYAEQGHAGRAARLLGAAEALRKAIGCPLPASEVCWHEREVAATRAALGDDAFESAWEEGRAMPWEEAVGYALEDANS